MPFNLSAWWKGNDNTDEEIGGVSALWITAPVYGAGVEGNAFLFKKFSLGYDPFLKVLNNDVFNFAPEDKFAVEFNIKFLDYQTQSYILCKGVEGFIDFGLRKNNFGAFYFLTAAQQLVYSGISITNANFHLIRMEYDNGFYRFYLDGVDVTPAALLTNQYLILNNARDLYIYANTGYSTITDTLIDNVKIYYWDDTPTPSEEDYMLKLMWEKVTMGFKKETVPYTAETLAVADYDNRAYDIKVSPEIEQYATKASRGDFSKEIDVSGRKKVSVSFSVDIYAGSAVNVAPKYFEMFETCGWKQTAFTTTGISLTPSADHTNVPATIEVVYPQEGTQPQQIVFKISGAMGKVKIEAAQVGQPMKATFEYTGCLVGISNRAYANIIVPSGFDTSRAPAMLAATFSLFGTWQFPSKFSIDGGEVIDLHSNIGRASGYEGAHISNREITMDCDPDMDLISSLDLYSAHINDTTGQLSITIGGAVPLTISAPVVQISDSYKPEAREGHVVNPLKLKMKRSTNGNDELEILQGAKA